MKRETAEEAAPFWGEDAVPRVDPPADPGRHPQGGSSPDSQAENQAKKAALEAYQKSNPAENGVTAKVTDYGCHMQVDIQKDGKVVKSYSYQGGKAFEIS